MNILIVEDDATLSAVLVRQFNVYNKVCAVSSLSDLNRFLLERQQCLDLVLLDKQLSDGSSIALIDVVKRHSPDSLVVIMSGDGDYHSVVKGIKAGADDYIVKSPELISELQIRIPIILLKRGSIDSKLPKNINDLSDVKFNEFLKFSESEYLSKAWQYCNHDIALFSKKTGLARSTAFKKISDLKLESTHSREAQHALGL